MGRKINGDGNLDHQKDLEEFIEGCCNELIHAVKKGNCSAARQWFLDIIAAYNTWRKQQKDEK